MLQRPWNDILRHVGVSDLLRKPHIPYRATPLSNNIIRAWAIISRENVAYQRDFGPEDWSFHTEELYGGDV